MKTTMSHSSGFTFVETLIVIGLLGLLATVALPNFLAAGSESNKKGIPSNLHHLHTAKTIWPPTTCRGAAPLSKNAGLVGPDKYLRQKPVSAASDGYVS